MKSGPCREIGERRGAHVQSCVPRLLGIALALMLCGCAQQRIREHAQELARTGEYEQATAVLEQGMKDHPDSTMLRSTLIGWRSDALARLIAEGLAARAAGRLDDAEAAFKRALAFDSNERAKSLLQDLTVTRRQNKALADAQALVSRKQPDAALRLIGEALKDNPRHADLLALQRQLLASAHERQVASSRSGLAETRPISLDFRDASLRTVLETVSRHSGLNFLLDKDIRSDIRVSIYLRSATVEDALDLIVSTHQLAKKVVDERTVLVYPNTPEKLREHQEQLVRVFYLASADAKGAASFLRSMLRLREPYVDERANMIALRESPENVALAERLIALYDSRDPEVLLELEVLEVRSSRLTDLGIKVPDTFTLTAFPPGGAEAITLGNLRDITRNDIQLGLGGATITLKRQVGDFNTLANPRIRARSREKAKVLIGDRVPVFTATTGQAGFVSDSVTYLDVGLKLDVEPTVFPDDEVAIKVNLEVSTIAREIRTASGSLAYQIGTRNASTLLRLKDGETQLLAGLISREDRMSASRIPGIGDLPVMGRLFSSQSDDSQRTELVLAITPRVLRNVRHPEAGEGEVWVGTEAQPRLRPVGGRPSSLESAIGTAAAVAVPAATAGTPLPAPDDARRHPPASRPASIVARLKGPHEVRAGDTFIVTVDVETALPLRGGPVLLRYPRERLTLLDVTPGDLLRRAPGNVTFSKTIDSTKGEARLETLRSEASGVTGQGTLATLRFRATTTGPAEVVVTHFEPAIMGDLSATKPEAPENLKMQVAP